MNFKLKKNQEKKGYTPNGVLNYAIGRLLICYVSKIKKWN